MKKHHLVLGLTLGLSACSDATQFSEKGIGKAFDGESTTSENQRNQEEPESTVEVATATSADGIDGAATQGAAEGTLPIPANAQEVLLSVCEQGTKKTLTQAVRFPENRNCRWNTAGNLGRKDAHLQAIEVQTSTITLPEGAQLCNLKINSKATTLHYDDFIILSLNGYVLLSSNQQILQGLEGSEDTSFKWDFSRIRGIPVDFESPAYCMGEAASVCTVPVTDVPGRFQFSIDPESLIHLADKVINNRTMNFSLIATGDNDDRDCYHTDMSLDFSLEYVEK